MILSKFFKKEEKGMENNKKTIDFHKLLQLAVEEEHWALDTHQNRVAFYTSFISAILAITVAGFIQVGESIHYWILLIGPLVTFVISIIALDGTFRFYQLFLEAVSIRAKCEQAIGITDPKQIPKNPPEYWKDESLLPDRHLNARGSTPSSSKFISQHLSLGYQRPTRRLFLFFQALSVVMGGVLVALATGLI